MALAPITGQSGAAQGAGSDSANSLSQLGEDYTRFLTLLTAQVQHQDPLAPMDATQFVSQLAQLSQVEQAVKSNSNLESLGAQMGSLLAVSGADMLGREVTVSSSQMTLSNGVVDGYYNVDEGATQVTATITDPVGQVVRKLTGLSTDASSLQKIDWDGLDEYGNPVLDGTYTVTVTARRGEDDPVGAYTYRKAEVQEVLFTEGQNYFKLTGDETIPAEAVLAASAG
ncbi:flagellar hook assembly protein FlgD [Cognatishimia sp. SS12]|uniref:flagellar hook assembly protein FlgD n=1 Tax=Cognatishimia sp. SS12 TaxID=2979465 RepID=UPI00232B2A65|nr:flagellar hook assembly protein FlgD [Cognatishimia sp. SS12]MDC0739456.1 flagellar hook assembly protein FlgD [Cognatishimia sp. SS12]